MRRLIRKLFSNGKPLPRAGARLEPIDTGLDDKLNYSLAVGQLPQDVAWGW